MVRILPWNFRRISASTTDYIVRGPMSSLLSAYRAYGLRAFVILKEQSYIFPLYEGMYVFFGLNHNHNFNSKRDMEIVFILKRSLTL